jgi:hypothetical protein
LGTDHHTITQGRGVTREFVVAGKLPAIEVLDRL